MKLVFPDEDNPLSEEWLEPLYVIEPGVRYDPAYQFFDVYDFMVMAKVIRSGRPNITEFKHRYTRRYLHLDILGRAYRYIPPTHYEQGKQGRFLRAESLEWALDRLLLWELPWLKDELEQYRFGLPHDEAWRLDPRFDPRRFLIDDMCRRRGFDDGWGDDVPPPDEEPPPDDRPFRLLPGGAA